MPTRDPDDLQEASRVTWDSHELNSDIADDFNRNLFSSQTKQRKAPLSGLKKRRHQTALKITKEKEYKKVMDAIEKKKKFELVKFVAQERCCTAGDFDVNERYYTMTE